MYVVVSYHHTICLLIVLLKTMLCGITCRTTSEYCGVLTNSCTTARYIKLGGDSPRHVALYHRIQYCYDVVTNYMVLCYTAPHNASYQSIFALRHGASIYH